MKRAGIIGGLGPESTVEYYRLIGAVHRARTGTDAFPPLLVNSIEMEKVLVLARAGRVGELAGLLLSEVERLARAGADFAAIAANTPHMAFGELSRVSPLPLVSIVACARDEALRLGLRRLALLGSRMTMEGTYYRDLFSPAGIELLLPSPDERAWVDRVYFAELVKGVFRDETRSAFLALARRMARDEAIDGVLLAGTELPLLLREPSHGALPFLDTGRLHAEAIVARMLDQA